MTIAMTTSIVTLKTKATEMQKAMTLTAEGEDDEELHDKRDKGGYDDGDHNDQRDDGSVVVHRKRLQKKLSMRILHQKNKAAPLHVEASRPSAQCQLMPNFGPRAPAWGVRTRCLAAACIVAFARASGVCDSYGGDMFVPVGSSAQVQLLTFPNATSSSSSAPSCEGGAVVTKLQSGMPTKLLTAFRTFTCCEFGSYVVVEEGDADPYAVAAGDCTSFVGDADANPIKLVCETTTEIPIRYVRHRQCRVEALLRVVAEARTLCWVPTRPCVPTSRRGSASAHNAPRSRCHSLC